MHYRVIFDVLRTWPDVGFAPMGLAFIFFGALMVYGVRKAGPGESPFPMRFFPYFFVGFAVVWTLGAGLGFAGSWWSAYDAMRSGRAVLLEGVVEDLEETGAPSRALETFSVQGHRLSVHDGGGGGTFAYPASRGGPIRGGQHVRIHALGERIVKLEIAAADLDGPVGDVTGHSGFPAIFTFAPLLIVPWMLLGAWAMPYVSGWRRLAKRFAGEPIVATRRFLFQSARLGFFGNYNNALIITIGRESFSMVPLLPFGAGHPLIVIPYSEIRTLTKTREFFADWVEVSLEGEERSFRIRGGAGDALIEAHGSDGATRGRRIGTL